MGRNREAGTVKKVSRYRVGVKGRAAQDVKADNLKLETVGGGVVAKFYADGEMVYLAAPGKWDYIQRVAEEEE